jgi:UDP-N-acetylmuramoylalanine--D-glutamate ligase
MMTASARPIRSVEDLRRRHAVVLGLARSGVAACRFLADAGAEVIAYDRRSPADLAAAVAELGGRPIRLALGVDEQRARAILAAADLVITSPSISSRFPTTDAWLREALRGAEARGAEVVSEVGLFLRLVAARIVGITGTKGKTTTASLVAAMLERAGLPTMLGGNIGTPLIERATELGPDDWVVLELSELQLPTIERGVDLALYTNIGEDHLDRHGTVAAYRAVKARLAELSLPDGRILLNHDDPGCRDLAVRLPGDVVTWYGLEASDEVELAATVRAGAVVVAGETILPVGEISLPGRHMLANVVGAALAARLAGAAPAAIREAIRTFPGVPHRLETVARRRDVRWVNDSQATIPAAAIAALRAFDAPVVLIAGGKDKGLDYAELADVAAERARACVLIGETAERIAGHLGDRVPVSRATGMEEAVRAAAAFAEAGDVVLLAPAAASFDMFVDYAARGDAFRAAVAGLEVAS